MRLGATTSKSRPPIAGNVAWLEKLETTWIIAARLTSLRGSYLPFIL